MPEEKKFFSTGDIIVREAKKQRSVTTTRQISVDKIPKQVQHLLVILKRISELLLLEDTNIKFKKFKITDLQAEFGQWISLVQYATASWQKD